MTVSGLLINITPDYMRKMSSLSKGARDTLLVLQFIYSNKTPKTIVDNFFEVSYSLVQKIAYVFDITMSESIYKTSMNELEENKVILKNQDKYSLTPMFEYLSLSDEVIADE